MKPIIVVFIMFLVLIFAIPPSADAGVPMQMSYQGRMEDPDGNAVPDNVYSIKFRIYDAETAGSELWSSDGFVPIAVEGGLFSHILGSTEPLPDTLTKYDSLWLGITIGLDAELSPRTRLVTSAFALKALVAERVTQGRDLYHEIVDVNPNSAVTVPFIAHGDSPRVTLYVYGSPFQGVLAEHTHDGVNPHAHDVSGNTNSASAAHTHSFSGTTASGGQSHTHSGTTASYNWAHTHTGSTNNTNLSHTHSGTTSTGGTHHHDFWFTGANDGLFLSHISNYNELTAHGQVQIRNASGSVTTLRSEHNHSFSTSSELGNHNHSFTTDPSGGNHNHSFSTGNASSAHTHTYSGTTGSNAIDHAHIINLVTEMFGGGLQDAGLSTLATPTGVWVIVDGMTAAGPFDGDFSSGALDLSGFVTGAGEHEIEISEQGGTGGRITYNLFVE